MPIFEVEHQGQVYEVDAPDINAAASAFDPAPAQAAIGPDPSALTSGKTGAAVSGLNAGVSDVLGLPVDTAANVIDLVKAGAGFVQSKVTGGAPSEMFDPMDRSQVPGSSEWIRGKGRDAGVAVDNPDPGGLGDYVHAAARGVPGAVSGGGLPGVVREAAAGALTGAAVQGAADAGLDPGAQAAAAMAVGAGAGAASASKASAARKTAADQPKAPMPVQDLRSKGFTARPSDVQAVQPGKKTPGQFREAVAGSEAVRSELGTKNAALSTRLAGEDIGLKNAERITQADIDAAVAPHKKVYHETAAGAGKWQASNALQKDLNKITADKTMDVKLRRKVAAYVDQFRNPNLSGSDVVGTISDLRARARKNMKDTATPETQEMGWAARRIADALEQELESRLMSVGGQASAKSFRDARQALAKIHDVEGSLKADIPDTHYFKKLRDRGVPLSGNLATLADAAEYLPEVNRHPQTLVRPGIGASSAASADTSMMGALRLGLTSGLRKHLGGEGFQSNFGKGPGPKAPSPPASTPAPSTPAPKRPTLSLPAPGGTSARNQGTVPGETQLADEMGLTGGELARRNMGLSPGQLNAAPRHPAYAVEQEFPTGGLSLAPDGPLPTERAAAPGDFDTGGLSLADEMSLNNGEPLSPDLAEFDTAGLSLVGDLLALPYFGNNAVSASPSRQGFSGATLLADELGLVGSAQNRADMGMTNDVIDAAQKHPGRARESIEQPAQQQQGKPPALSDDLGLSVVPNPTEPGYFDIVDAQGRVQATVEGQAQAQALLGDELVEPGPTTAATRKHTPNTMGKLRGPR